MKKLSLLFSSPLWGFLYLISNMLYYSHRVTKFSSPLWGFLYLITKFLPFPIRGNWFSSPLWGFLYLMTGFQPSNCTIRVLVPSLGISLFNGLGVGVCYSYYEFSSPLWGFLYLIMWYSFKEIKKLSSRPLSGDFFI